MSAQHVVVDASAGFVHLLGDPEVGAALDHCTSINVPALFAVEVASAARGGYLRGELTAARAVLLLDTLADYPATVWRHDAILMRRGWELRDNITSYDAVYVALCERLGASFLTADLKLVAAVRAHTAVDVIAVAP